MSDAPTNHRRNAIAAMIFFLYSLIEGEEERSWQF
jgi:hypothetical protein